MLGLEQIDSSPLGIPLGGDANNAENQNAKSISEFEVDMLDIREPSVAGLFYPASGRELEHVVQELLASAQVGPKIPKAIIAPHAGYIYSGPVSANAYAVLARGNLQIRRVVILGPAHRIGFPGIAMSPARAWKTPLGIVSVDREVFDLMPEHHHIEYFDPPHEGEHSIEVQLPFLQMLLSDFSIVPLLVGYCSTETVSNVLKQLWGGQETLIVVSTDLSHYHEYTKAIGMDRHFSHAVENLEYESVSDENACGALAVRGLLKVAKEKNMRSQVIDLRTSGDTAGTREHVVGYGAFHFFTQEEIYVNT